MAIQQLELNDDARRLMEDTIRVGDVDFVRELLDEGFPVDEVLRPRLVFSPLQLACYEGTPEICALLLARGADVQRGTQGVMYRNALYIAAEQSHRHPDKALAVWDLLVAAGARLQGSTPLHGMDSNKVCEFVLARGIDPNVLDHKGKAPLHYYLEPHPFEENDMYLKNAESLIAAGADPFLMPEQCLPSYLTPFQHAVAHGHVAHVDFILQRFEVDLAQRTLAGKTLLDVADANPEVKALLLAMETQVQIQHAIDAHETSSAPKKSSGMSPL